ncbi:hypothetical protein BJP39_17960 [Streptomyces sp. CC77]|nr:hypothetical protein BJP39_17960 [Streptomyces sp. CC77]
MVNGRALGEPRQAAEVLVLDDVVDFASDEPDDEAGADVDEEAAAGFDDDAGELLDEEPRLSLR